MWLIGLAVVLTIGLALAPLAAEGQQAEKVYRVGILWPDSEPATSSGFDVLRQSLADSGYVEGTNLSFSHRWSGGRRERLRDLATELVHLKVDVLFASTGFTIRALAEATTAIPIVMISMADPVDTGLITSLPRPGGNITGVSGRVEELNEKLLELLKESVPSVSRVAVLGTPTAVGLYRKGMEVAARSLRVRLRFLEVASLKELDATFETAAKARAEGLVLLPLALFASMRVGSPGSHCNAIYPRSSGGARLLKRAASWPTGRTVLTCGGVPERWSRESSRVRDPLICQSNKQIASASSSISRPPRHLA
jgi:putative tryptophan/tyrosine transport system substrate-binding protein